VLVRPYIPPNLFRDWAPNLFGEFDLSLFGEFGRGGLTRVSAHVNGEGVTISSRIDTSRLLALVRLLTGVSAHVSGKVAAIRARVATPVLLAFVARHLAALD